MLYTLLADLFLIIHGLFILFVIAGGLLVFWKRWIAWLHVPAALWGALIEFLGWICPLTYLENDLRHAAGALGYSGGFIAHYLLPIVYPAGLNSTMQWLLGVLVIGVNLVIYGFILARTRNFPGSN
ncbi:MAG: DUF2784 domain-containing protein [Gammaproteobacteria bacterium]